MTCMDCGAAMKTKRENYRYEACGLRGVTLLNVEVSRCPRCGESEVNIPNMDGLHRTIAQMLVRRRERFAPEEIRFLRKYLGLGSGDLAAHMGVSPETVSRWEGGRSPMASTADRLLRMLVATRQPVSHYPLEMLKDVAQEAPRPMKVGMKADGGGWHPAAREMEPAMA